ncbi:MULTISPECIES: hypothetical protein [unclassified Aureimonas]|uniref:hypothetical protein n=1 Tax=unclassified Aureimonas TaxID=2615206 RepID=UPI0006FB249A|nr:MULTISPECIES: hypothetical protein [unclassified Aureimonas]KQT52109.1 hypothetical protein ASG62_15695 [Aureimonas sp. Leaf427]KQT70658.1 hypothetical protein ASG54_22255 [Aureimonas sp. Leaf460]
MKPVRVVLASLVAAIALTGAASAGGRYDRDIVVVQSYEQVRDRGDWRDARDDDDIISERRLARQLRRQGFVEIEDIDLRRDRYIVRAVRPNGALVRLAVDAYDGEILARERIGWAGDRGPRGPRADYGRDRGSDPRDFGRPHPPRDRDGIEFDLGGASVGIYTR